MKNQEFHIAIIGAGVAGMTAAWRLQAAGISCKLYDKSRGVGGRLATRRTREGVRFDHGAQYFTARSSEFQRALKSTPWAGQVEPWTIDTSIGADGYVGAPTMKSPLKEAARSLDIQLNAKVSRIERIGSKWRLSGEGLETPQDADIVIISAPAPQAYALVPFSDHLQANLSAVKYEPCWALMVAFAQADNTSPMTLAPKNGVFSWIAKNSSKPGRDKSPESWVAHAGPIWSEEHLECDKEDVAERLLPHLLAQIGAERTPIYVSTHRWRYARVAEPAKKPFLTDETKTVFVIGDGCLGPRVECAFESGNKAADHILQLPKK